MDNVTKGLAGLSYFSHNPTSKSHRQKEPSSSPGGGSKSCGGQRGSRMVDLRQQGPWPNWESVLRRRVTWDNILQTNYYRVRFLLQAVYDGLLSLANLHILVRVIHHLVLCALVEDPICTSSEAA